MTTGKTFTLSTDSGILQFFPENARNRKHPQFAKRVSRYLRKLFDEVGGLIESLSVSRDEIKVSWKEDQYGPGPLDGIVNMLQHERYSDAIVMMELFLSSEPDNTDFLYNLGMAYSDIGHIDRSIELLNRLLDHEPKNVNGRVALGVALMRNNQEDKALEELKVSVQDDPDNPWARRNLGALLAKAGKFEDALPHMRKAAELNPDDQRAWYGLGQVLEEIGKREEADNAYRKTVDLDEFTDVAELARQARSRIAQKTFRSVTPQMERMDAVMYLLGALEKFEGMPPEEIQQVGFEIAMLGTKGLDVNDPTPKYQIRTLPGTFSGLHLVCYEYAAFKEFAPEMDIGFDLSAEYRSARALFQKKKGKKE